MTETPWMRECDEWVKTLSDGDVARLAASINRASHLDENEGDRAERRQSLEWLLSRGARGVEWGIVGAHARRLGLWGPGTRGTP